MNMEVSLGEERIELEDESRRQRRLRLALIAAIVLVVALVGWSLLHRKGAPAKRADSAPIVTVIVPGRQAITANVTAPGNIGARRDMPVGVAGEGGLVRAVLVEAGDWVKAGQVLATVDRSVQVQQAASLAASILQAKADAALAKANLERARKLVGNGFVSKADLDTREATLAGANARVAVATAQLGQQRALIGRLDIRAPTDGLVLTRGIEAGQVVGAGSGALFRVAEHGAMEVRANLAETDLAHVRVGATAWVTPVGTNLKIAGKVWQVAPVIDANTRQGTVRVALGYNPALRPGGFGTVDIGGASAEVPLLPESAVLSDTKGNFVYVVGADDKVARREVKVGGVDDRGVSVVAGLAGNERVVASAGAFLNIGDKITPQIAGR